MDTDKYYKERMLQRGSNSQGTPYFILDLVKSEPPRCPDFHGLAYCHRCQLCPLSGERMWGWLFVYPNLPFLSLHVDAPWSSLWFSYHFPTLMEKNELH